MSEGVSIIICCYNSVTRLRETLKHLALQKTEALPWEIVLVDNASTDSTREVAIQLWHAFNRTDVMLSVVDERRQGLSFARKKGIDASRYDILIFCDDDNWLDENYIYCAFGILKAHSKVGAVGGTGSPFADIPLPVWFERHKSSFACFPQGTSEGEMRGYFSSLFGAGFAVKRNVLENLSARNFIPILPDRIGTQLTSGGDTELSYAIRLSGYTLWFSEKLHFIHYLPSSRLSEKYLYRLVSSLSYCSGLLLVYNYALAGKKVNVSVWMKDALYQIYFFVRTLLSYPFSRDLTLEKRLNLTFSYNRMRSVFHQVGTYTKHYENIVKLKP